MDNIAILNQLKAILGIDVEKNNPYRVPKGPKGGQFTSRRSGGGSAASAGSDKKPSGGGSGGGSGGKQAPTKAVLSDAEQAKLRAKLNAEGGEWRDKPRTAVLNASHKDAAGIDAYYKKGPDGGATFSGHWDKSMKPPAGYPKDWPTQPGAVKARAGKYGSKETYALPKGVTMDIVNKLDYKNPAHQHLARVLTHEVVAHARARAGGDNAGIEYNKTSAKKLLSDNKLTTIAAWEMHHIIPAGKGGSNFGGNLALVNGGEHNLLHGLEAVLAPTLGSGGKAKTNTLGMVSSIARGQSSRSANAVTKQLGPLANDTAQVQFGYKGKKVLKGAELAAWKTKRIKNSPNVKMGIAGGILPKSGFQANKDGEIVYSKAVMAQVKPRNAYKSQALYYKAQQNVAAKMMNNYLYSKPIEIGDPRL